MRHLTASNHLRAFMLSVALLIVNIAMGQINLKDSTLVKDGLAGEWAEVYGYLQRTMNFSMAIPQEKVYLHFDNTGYFQGETMWYKAYVVRADNGRATDISSVLYVELVTPGGDVLDTHKLYIDNGEAHGEFKLDSLYSTGFYEVRAYTRYMTNWGNGACFSRTFPIFKTPKKEGDYSQLVLDKYTYKLRMPDYREKAPEPSIKFYPESGNLVEGLPGRVAFTVIDREGKNFEAKGMLLDSDKQPVQAVVTFEEGKGWFDFVPNDEPYYLRLVSKNDGKIYEFELPEARVQGVTMMVDALHDDYVTATLHSSIGSRGRLLGYSLMCGGKILMCDTITAKESQMIKFVRKDLPGGVHQLTVFDADGRIQAERLFFVCPKRSEADSVYISTTNDRPVPCGKVTVNIKTQPNAHLSFSAMDLATLPNGKEGNALTWMLLGSEVKGYIAHPEYYLEADDREHRVAADMLMMVQGWRRYDWNLMAGKDDFSKVQIIEDSLYLHGNLKPKRKYGDVSNVELHAWLYNRLGDWVHGVCMTDSVGHYAFRLPNMSGDWRLLMRTRKDSIETNYRVCIDRNFSPATRWVSPYETEYLAPLKANLFANLPDSVYDDLEDLPILKRENVLPNVKVKAHRRIYDNARASWESERHGQYAASIYYNVEKEVDKLLDEGQEAPGLYEWLYKRNPLFETDNDYRFLPTTKNPSVTKTTVIDDSQSYALDKSAIDYVNDFHSNPESPTFSYTYFTGHFDVPSSSETREYSPNIWEDGLSYKGRPVVWIHNNNFAGITSARGLHLNDLYSESISIEPFPVFADEVKSIYISEKTNAYKHYLYGSSLMPWHPVTVFVYTRHSFLRKVKGLRRTYYQAYNDPETFVMDDYSVIPPMEDFRRTIYWNPEVKADANGRAQVEFYNNSSCRQMYISCEGLTPEGKFVTNE